MLPRGLSNVLAKVLARRRDQSLSSQSTSNSLPETFDVGLTYNWSNDTLDVVNARPSRPTPTPLHASPTLSSRSITNSPLKADPELDLGNTCTPVSTPRTLSDTRESAFSVLCEQDVLNEPLNALMSPPPTAIIQSQYGKKLPLFLYKAESTPSGLSQGFHYQTPLTSPKALPLPLPPSPASSTRTRPLFLPSPSSTPFQVEESYTGDTSARKRKDRPAPFDTPISRSKRPRTDLDIIDIDDDDDDNDDDNDYNDWTPQPIDTGYRALRTPTGFSVERSPDFSGESSVAYAEALESDSETNANQTSSVRQNPTCPRGVGVWPGPEGGAITFRAKPPKFNEKAFSRWSYSNKSPKNSTVGERTDGDIHFSPSDGIGTNEPFNYWVCVKSQHGMRWVDFNCGQPHPLYKGFVLKPANITRKAPPKWVKAASYRASRSC